MNITQAKEIIDMNQTSYDKISTSFSASRYQNWDEVKVLIDKYVEPGDKILDLGCGNGRLIKLLSNHENVSYIGADNSVNLIQQAQKQLSGVENSNIKFVVNDILNLTQFDNNSFDKVFMIASFNHVPSLQLRQQVMQELHRILKPGGILIMTNWNLWQIKSKKSVWSCRKNKKQNCGFKDVITLWQNKHPLYYRAFTLGELKRLFNQAGFEILSNKYVNRNKPAYWWNGWNLVSAGQKTANIDK